jgi:hypothetical protein
MLTLDDAEAAPHEHAQDNADAQRYQQNAPVLLAAF